MNDQYAPPPDPSELEAAERTVQALRDFCDALAALAAFCETVVSAVEDFARACEALELVEEDDPGAGVDD